MLPLDAAVTITAFLLLVAAAVVFTVRNPARWRVYLGRFGLAIGFVALASIFIQRFFH